MSGTIPPQFQGNHQTAKSNDDDLCHQYTEFKLLVRSSFCRDISLQLEVIYFDVHNVNYTMVDKTDVVCSPTIYVGMTKKFISYAIMDALRTQDLDFIIIFFPDLSRAWRTKMSNDKDLDVKFELYLTDLSLQIVPKCMETWCYRRWLYNRIDSAQIESPEIEWSLIYRSAKLHKCNYYAWEHARWLIQLATGYSTFKFDRFEEIMKLNVTDCSIYSFASFVFFKFDNLLDSYALLSKNLIRLYPDNQILLNFRYLILSTRLSTRSSLTDDLIWVNNEILSKQTSRNDAIIDYVRKINNLLKSINIA